MNTAATPQRVMTSVALKAVFAELAPSFRQQTGCDLVMSFGPAGTLVERLKAGDTGDVVVVTPASMDDLISGGHVVAGSQRNVARSRIGVAVRAGAPRPAIATPEDFKRALLAARAVAYTNPATGAASGVHVVELLERFGIADAIKAKAVLGDGGPVAEFLARGEADLAIQQLCEHMLVDGVDVVGPLPDELQRVTTFTAGVGAKAATPDDGRALIALLVTPSSQARLAAHGLERV
jgi:molybdate transport system substrate-binding protein